ncbi:MAG: phage tail protein [Longispora sp.]|nr:phage tail protein [Longispora sp. (in: high G+C Gram-positive bacteria)]
MTAPGGAGASTAPITANRFTIDVGGEKITFQELNGINAEVESAEYWAADDKGPAVNKLAGKLKPPTITFRRGMDGSLTMWAWHEAVRNGQMAAARKSCSLVMYNAEGKPVAKYWLEGAWPSKMELTGLKAGSSEALVETVTLMCERIQRMSV